MAVTVQNGGTFPTAAGSRPGLYVRFVAAAIAAIQSGARSTVATIVTDITGGTAVFNTVYTVTNMADAGTLFGADNAKHIEYALIGGASKVVVMPVQPTTGGTPGTDIGNTGWTTALQTLEGYDFHVFVTPPAPPASLNSAAIAWLKTAKTDGKNFMAVFADSAGEGTVATLTADATTYQDEYAVFVGNGVVDATGTNVTADLYAAYIAGLIAGTGLGSSLTYANVPFADVITRFRNADVQTLLAANILVTTMLGSQPHIEQGLSLGDTTNGEFNKIRTVRAKQQLIDDINTTVAQSYIGKITNSTDGQIAIINAVKAYLQTLANANVVDPNFTVGLDKTQVSTGDKLYIVIGVTFLDSIEYVYLTISV